MDRIIGFSTGVLFNEPMNLIAKIERIRNAGCRAIELAFLNVSELFDGAAWLTPEILCGFDWVSIHMPTKIKYGNNRITKRIFEQIRWIGSHRRLGLDLAIIHPVAVSDFSVFEFRWTGIKFAFENMDWRKKNFEKPYQRSDELIEIFSNYPQYGFVLDVAHLFNVDPTLALANGFSELTDKLVEIHISGYNNYHIPLYETKQIELIKLASRFARQQRLRRSPCGLAKPDTPIIIESVLPPEMMEEELNYILQHL